MMSLDVYSIKHIKPPKYSHFHLVTTATPQPFEAALLASSAKHSSVSAQTREYMCCLKISYLYH